MQVIDTRFLIQKANKNKSASDPHKANLTVHDLHALELLAVYLAGVYEMPEEECFVALQEDEPQLITIQIDSEQVLRVNYARNMRDVGRGGSGSDNDAQSDYDLVSDESLNQPRLLETMEDADPTRTRGPLGRTSGKSVPPFSFCPVARNQK